MSTIMEDYDSISVSLTQEHIEDLARGCILADHEVTYSGPFRRLEDLTKAPSFLREVTEVTVSNDSVVGEGEQYYRLGTHRLASYTINMRFLKTSAKLVAQNLVCSVSLP
jgi:hypothetical protein